MILIFIRTISICTQKGFVPFLINFVQFTHFQYVLYIFQILPNLNGCSIDVLLFRRDPYVFVPNEMVDIWNSSYVSKVKSTTKIEGVEIRLFQTIAKHWNFKPVF